MTAKSITLTNCAWRADMWRLGDLHLTPEGAFFFVFQPRPLPLWVPLAILAAAFAVTVYVGMVWVWLTVLAALVLIAWVKQISLRQQRTAWRAALAESALPEAVAAADHAWHVPPEKLARVELHLEPTRQRTMQIVIVRRDEVKLVIIRGAGARTLALRDEIAAVVNANGWSAA